MSEPPRRALLSPSALATAGALSAVGAVFVLKYGSEVSPLAGVGAIAFAAGYVGMVVAVAAFALRLPKDRARRLGMGIEAVLLLGAVVLAFLAPEANDVARLPALKVWLERLFGDAYPYGLPIRPSGFPGLFAIALPFWATGLLRLLPVAGLVVFLAVLRRNGPAARLPALVGLALLPSFYYEVVVHSELFLNSALVLGSLWVFEAARRRGYGPLLLAGVLAGLLLSTRLYVGAVYAVYGAFAFRADRRRGVAFASAAFAVWAATWVPFLAWDAERFAAFGPFAVQGLYLPRWLIAASVGGALALGWRAPDLRAVSARSGWLLLGLVAVAGALAVDRAYPLAMFLGFDVSYLVLPTPFLLVALAAGQRGDGRAATPADISELSTPAPHDPAVSSDVQAPRPPPAR